MTPSDDPFDARPTAELLATDALLDRVGARAPTPDDLDDPLIAALALMAAEIDLDAPPLDDTRAALAQADPEFQLSRPASEGPPHDEATGLVIDLRDSASSRSLDRDQVRRPQRRPRQPERVAPPAAMAPPRSLPRMPAPGAPGGPRAPRAPRERRMRPLLAVAVAVGAIVLGSGVSAALTGGRSVNPLDGVQQVVAELRGGRTQDQQQAYDEVKRHLDAAQKAADDGDRAAARSELQKIDKPLLQRLTDEDRARAQARLAQLDKRVTD
jgi:hypothetical protein